MMSWLDKVAEQYETMDPTLKPFYDYMKLSCQLHEIIKKRIIFDHYNFEVLLEGKTYTISRQEDRLFIHPHDNSNLNFVQCSELIQSLINSAEETI
jgi:hypothetical protein